MKNTTAPAGTPAAGLVIAVAVTVMFVEQLRTIGAVTFVFVTPNSPTSKPSMARMSKELVAVGSSKAAVARIGSTKAAASAARITREECFFTKLRVVFRRVMRIIRRTMADLAHNRFFAIAILRGS